MTHLGGSAFQGCSRGQPDAHLRGGPVPAGAAQHSQTDPLTTAGLKRRSWVPQSRPPFCRRRLPDAPPFIADAHELMVKFQDLEAHIACIAENSGDVR